MKKIEEYKESFRRWGDFIINLREVVHCDTATGKVELVGGRTYTLPPKVIEKWFSGVVNDIAVEDRAPKPPWL